MKELTPTISQGQKSFYKKAMYSESELGYTLYSYETPICRYSDRGFVKYWNDYSLTTMKHINAFRCMLGLDVLTKSEWLSLPVGTHI